MNKRNFMTLACVLAYLVVFAHSAIAHEHHRICRGGAETAESDEQHDSHYGSCETLNTFLLNSDDAEDFTVGSSVVFIPAAPLVVDGPSSVRVLESHGFIFLDSLWDTLVSGALSLRAPPSAI